MGDPPSAFRTFDIDRADCRAGLPSVAMADDDFTLLDRWSAGDKVAGNALFTRHFESLYRFLEQKVDGDLDDVVQETLLACLHGRDKFRRQSSFKTYLFAIARFTLIAYWRRRAGAARNLDFDEISVASLSTSAGTRLARHEDRAVLLGALRALPMEQQLLLEMYYWEGLDREQLAEVFEVAPATIGSRLFRARQSLADGLAASDGRTAGAAAADLDAWARALGPDRPAPAGEP